MHFVSGKEIAECLEYNSLIEALRIGFGEKIEVPMRHHHDYANPFEGIDSTLLLMPAWKAGDILGVKTVTVSPANSKYDLPSIHGLYLLFDARDCQPIAVLDAKSLTTIRTAATSALASSYLAPQKASSMLMIGTGALAPELIKAHHEICQFEEIFIWGRDFAKAQKVAKTFKGLNVLPVKELATIIPDVDLISVATLSQKPLVTGELLSEHTHIDLVGAYRKDMREADDTVLLRSSLFVDSIESAPFETGDLVIPLKDEVISLSDIRGDLFDLCTDKVEGRKSENEITCFKSVGHALEDLVAAKLVADKLGLL